MTHWEAFTQAKDKDNPDSNEDRIVVVPDRLYAVIDGATDKSGKVYDGLTGGQIAGRALEGVLWNVARASERSRPIPVAAIAIRQGATTRFIVIGDTGLRLNGKECFSSPKPGDIVCAQIRVAVHRFLTARGTGIDATNTWARAYTVEGLRAVLPGSPGGIGVTELEFFWGEARRESCKRLGDIAARDIDDVLSCGLKGLHRFANRPGPFGFPTIDGAPVPSEMIVEFERPAGAVTCMEFFSDGYSTRPCGTTVADWEADFERLELGDPQRVGQHPETKGSSAKKFADDRTILIVRPSARTGI